MLTIVQFLQVLCWTINDLSAESSFVREYYTTYHAEISHNVCLIDPGAVFNPIVALGRLFASRDRKLDTTCVSRLK